MPESKKKPKPQPAVDLTQLVRFYAPTVVKALKGHIPQSYGKCCCCCCCGDKQGRPARDPLCNVDEFDVNQELRLDPNSFGVLLNPLIIGTRAEISWSVTAPIGSTVTVQIRTRGPNGNPGGAFSDWTDIFTGQALIDQVRYEAQQVLGTKVEFRIVVKDGDGQTICVGPPDS